MPHPNATSLLDLGCGSAVWIAAVATGYPKIDVVGVDVTPPSNSFGLGNLTLVEADIEETWSLAGGEIDRYDLITIRVLASAIRDWP